jgi:NADPH:quinone reductase
MKALQTLAPGGWDSTAVRDIDDPVRDEHDVIVEIAAASLNPADAFLIEGRYPGGPKPPFIAGRDAAGTVAECSMESGFDVGDRVAVVQSRQRDLAAGTFCQRQKFGADTLIRIPDNWSFAEAATALVYQTAWRAIFEPLQPTTDSLARHPKLPADAVIAVTGASGGVGLAAVQIGLSLGAQVVALSRSESSRERLRNVGAQHVFSPEQADLKKAVFASIGRKGVDAVVETVGGPMLGLGVHLLGYGGRVGVVGVLAGVEGSVPIPSLMFKRASVHGIQVGEIDPSESVMELSQIVEHLENAGLRPVVDSTFALEEYVPAFDKLRDGCFGKVVIEP